jgi:hypothetical protein
VLSPSRRSLDALVKLLQLSEPDDWPTHLRRASEIVAQRKSVEETKTIIVQAVKAAHRCAQGISQMLLSNSQSSTSIKFHTSCVRIVNCLKPTRLRKETRNALDEVARHTFAERDVNTESVSDFLLGCQKVLEQGVQDKNSAEILKYLGLTNDSRFGQLEDKKRGLPTLPIVTWYESLMTKLRLELESKLRQAIERQLHLTAHDIFSGFASSAVDEELTERTNDTEDLLASYVEEVAKVWVEAGLRVGRATKADDAHYVGPFENFVERVLLSQFDTRFSFFNRPDEEQMKKAWHSFYSLPEDFQEAGSRSIHQGSRLISDRLLRRVLQSFSKKTG